MATSSAKSKAKKSRSNTTTAPAKQSPEAATDTQSSDTESRPIASSWVLARRAADAIWGYRIFFLKLSALYLVLDWLFVQTLSQLSVTRVTEADGGAVSATFGQFSTLITRATTGSSGAGDVYHLFLTLLISLAALWGLQRIFSGQPPAIEDLSAKLAVYRGTGQLIPFMLLMILLVIQLLPLAIAMFLFSVMSSGFILASGIEKYLALAIIVMLLIATFAWIARTVVALYVVVHPDTLPLDAYARAKQLIRGRRLALVGRLLALPVVLLVALGIVVIPLILLWPGLARLMFYVLIPVIIIAMHTYLYALYQELARD